MKLWEHPRLTGALCAAAVLAFLLYMVCRPYKEATTLEKTPVNV